MIIGFTGTSLGMSAAQKLSLTMVLEEIADKNLVISFHHGDCIGADSQADQIVSELFMYGKSKTKAVIEIHPPDNPRKQAFCTELPGSRLIYSPRPYLERNHAIVDGTDLLIAAPDSADERLRSGTWATVRYARKQGKKIILIFPDGYMRVEVRNGKTTLS